MPTAWANSWRRRATAGDGRADGTTNGRDAREGREADGGLRARSDYPLVILFPGYARGMVVRRALCNCLFPTSFAAIALVGPAAGHELTPEAVREIALDAIRSDPILMSELVDAAEAAEAGDARRLITDDNAPVIGNPDGDVTLVKFFDYNCPYCRRAEAQMLRLLARDPDLRVVYREWPIFGAGSTIASKAALAAREQGRYAEMHAALLASGVQLDEAAVMRIAAEVGLDPDRLRDDMKAARVQAHLDESARMAEALGLSGTPWFVLGEELIPGVVDAVELHRLVRDARAE